MEEWTRDMRIVCEVIGREATRKLMRELGGISVYIPRAGEAEIAEALKRYYGDAKIVAARLGVSQRRVYNVQRKLREERGHAQRRRTEENPEEALTADKGMNAPADEAMIG